MLFHRARADAQLPCDFFVAAASHQQIEDLLVPGRNLHSIHVHHFILPIPIPSASFATDHVHPCPIAHLSPNILRPIQPALRHL